MLQVLIKRFSREIPEGHTRMCGCLHITTETANLARFLVSGGADPVLTLAP
ncbi:hypothetical protein [Desulfopila inferna]|uniref:hypothetical protein n=1 Tax=Desulfopila inferna TaxID=468528 RepID=UPI0019622D56|nr:hypothetical protein [Desulfopila inferna]MBM9603070.1 hypothetical protein [Desulfopila inferna]